MTSPDDKLFFRILEEKHLDLLQVSIKNRYTFLIPSSRYLSPNMITRNFYENHMFFSCEYDRSLMVSLSGKVMEVISNSTLGTYLGFRKSMQFNIVEELDRCINIPGNNNSNSVRIVHIDNIIDEDSYNPMISSSIQAPKNKDALKQCSSSDEYIEYYHQMSKKNYEFQEVEIILNELITKLKNNYILIKNHVQAYAMYFHQDGVNFRDVSMMYMYEFYCYCYYYFFLVSS